MATVSQIAAPRGQDSKRREEKGRDHTALFKTNAQPRRVGHKEKTRCLPPRRRARIADLFNCVVDDGGA
eukprot:6589022-Pyramimonas_sp.AAC.1